MSRAYIYMVLVLKWLYGLYRTFKRGLYVLSPYKPRFVYSSSDSKEIPYNFAVSAL